MHLQKSPKIELLFSQGIWEMRGQLNQQAKCNYIMFLQDKSDRNKQLNE